MLLLNLKVATLQLELRERASRNDGDVLRVLRSHLKVATLQPELRGRTSSTTCLLARCDFAA